MLDSSPAIIKDMSAVTLPPPGAAEAFVIEDGDWAPPDAANLLPKTYFEVSCVVYECCGPAGFTGTPADAIVFAFIKEASSVTFVASCEARKEDGPPLTLASVT